MAQEVKKVGFIGLGDIGLPMAKRVVTGGFETTVCGHVRQEPVEKMKSLGAKEVKTPKEVAQASDVVIAMVRDDVDTGEIVLGPEGVLEGLKHGGGIILMSTLSPTFCKKVGQVGGERGIGVIDAPVTGARMRAETGDLGIMVGGEKELVEKYRPVLETMGKITYCGELGMGEVVKLVNNMVLDITAVGVYEAISWGIRNGASEELLVELMKTGTARCWILENWEYTQSMMTDPPPATYLLGAKDLSYALRIGKELKIACPLAALACEFMGQGPLKLAEKP